MTLTLTGRLDLLFAIYPEFYLPQAVFNELGVHLEKYTPKPDDIMKILQPHVLPIEHHEWLTDYKDELGPGEKECLILARETGISNLLTDDLAARKYAESTGIKCFGSLAIFIKAKQLGLIEALGPYFLTLSQSDRFFHSGLLNQILLNSGETPLEI